LMGASIKSVKATVLAGRMDDHNTFDQPDVVFEKAFDDISFEGDKITFKIPASSVMHIEVEI
nr:alpha-N-arabinofuranosidase [Saccharofermentans sp.]